ncbi:EF-hand domain-containing protein [Pseudomethylobacillus aquaticus]|uniref:EF-hand domain-containing protein n=1 Tax=Pseudomethylobacillus aquaticus TaxID=2676064 RepID=A0A3N0V7R9_9PROT|nr:EF-hand domain-containing protein [Pseudomethylobacillus aquaticus]ROH88624.1 EF-hand domain-containing protein [Pseudomethylobacillus aquaticus]
MPAQAGPKNIPNSKLADASFNSEAGNDSDVQVITEAPANAVIKATLEQRVSMEELMRLRKDLDDYSRSIDPAHVQIEERRRVMRQRIQERFLGSDKDNDGSISREEATETMPQIARQFSVVDLNGDGVITLNELEQAQARALERQRAHLLKMQQEALLAAETERAEKAEAEKAKNKQAASVNRRKSAL